MSWRRGQSMTDEWFRGRSRAWRRCLGRARGRAAALPPSSAASAPRPAEPIVHRPRSLIRLPACDGSESSHVKRLRAQGSCASPGGTSRPYAVMPSRLACSRWRPHGMAPAPRWSGSMKAADSPTGVLGRRLEAGVGEQADKAGRPTLNPTAGWTAVAATPGRGNRRFAVDGYLPSLTRRAREVFADATQHRRAFDTSSKLTVTAQSGEQRSRSGNKYPSGVR